MSTAAVADVRAWVKRIGASHIMLTVDGVTRMLSVRHAARQLAVKDPVATVIMPFSMTARIYREGPDGVVRAFAFLSQPSHEGTPIRWEKLP